MQIINISRFGISGSYVVEQILKDNTTNITTYVTTGDLRIADNTFSTWGRLTLDNKTYVIEATKS